MFSRRTEWDLSPNALTRALASRRAAGGSVVDLTITNPTAVGLRHPPSLFAGLVDSTSASYEPEPLGLLRAREEVAAYYRARGSACDPAAVFLCASTSEAFGWLLSLVCDPGDAVLVPRPGYPLLDYLAALFGVRLVPYPLCFDGSWHIDLGALRELVRAEARVRAVIATSPGNPTGAVLGREELAALEALCAERELALVVDEVFLDYPLGAARGPLRSALGPRSCLCFVLSGVSKVALLPQWKLSWGAVCGPGPLVARALERLTLIADTFLSVSTPAQLALAGIFAAAPELQARVSERTSSNLAELARALAGGAASVLAGAGGWAAVIRLPSLTGVDDEAWALELLDRGGVVVHPGSLYDLDGSHCVVSLLTEPKAFAAGTAALAREVARRVAE